MDRDTTKKKGAHEAILHQFRSHKADVLLGTQMIAKGHHFPSVTLVGILNADASLFIPDFRAAETTFQLLTQVAGRAGRALDLPGQVILQTQMPDHPLFRLASGLNYDAFYEREIRERNQFGYPPSTKLIKCLFSGPDAHEVCEVASRQAAFLQSLLPPSCQILPPSPAGHPKIQGRFRFQFFIKAPKQAKIQPLLQQLPPLKSPLRRKIDVDPIHLFF
jgi:primosomal protein N' (replication factor Y)